MPRRINIAIIDTPVSVEKVSQEISDPTMGGEVLFFGSVRNTNSGKPVRGIYYDCFEPLAKKVLMEISEEVQKEYGEQLNISIFHSTGYLKAGQISVGIGVGTHHREEAFQACRLIIDQIKTRAPIWKKEYYEDGTYEWLGGNLLEPGQTDRESVFRQRDTWEVPRFPIDRN